MSDTVIRVENLGKKYIIGHQQQQERYTALRDVIANGAKGLIQRFNPRSQAINHNIEEFWALKDVSFEVKRGDRIGIIGRNGAGKSTLLKILSRITEPTTGKVQIKGRVASLLEVGTGFHPELTGRENIYLNGAILGMSKQEIRRKFDEIVAFAEIEKFLDTPVKRYSSGMYVRLAFAVAAHLEPEILIVDEVLAVGDVQFQKKCLGKMEEVGNEGRTVLFVSHNMATIQKLCNSCIFLTHGHTAFLGDMSDGIRHYLNSLNEISKSIQVKENKFGISILDFYIQDSFSQEKVSSLVFNYSYIFRLKLNSSQALPKIALGISIYNSLGILVSSIFTPEEGIDYFTLQGKIDLISYVPSIQLMPGSYYMSLIAYTYNQICLESDKVASFEVIPCVLNNASRAYRGDQGIVRVVKNLEIK